MKKDIMSSQYITEVLGTAESVIREINPSDINEFLIENYRVQISGATRAAAKIQVENLNRIINEFDANLKEASEDRKAWAENWLNQQIQDKTPAERCQILFTIVNGFNGAAAIALGDDFCEQNARQAERAAIDPNAVTPMLEEQLLAQALAALQSSNLFAVQLGELAALVEQSDPEGVAQRAVDFETYNKNVKAIASVLLYIMAQRPKYRKQFPDGITLEQTAIGVCQTFEAQRVAAQVASGDVTTENAVGMLGVIGAVAAAIFVASQLVSAAVAFVWVVSGIAAVGAMAFIATEAWGKLCQACLQLIKAVTRHAVKAVFVAAKAISDAFGKLYAWAKEKAVPATVNAMKKGIELVMNLVHAGIATADKVKNWAYS